MSCCVARRDLCIAQGDDRRFRVNVVDQSNNPVDISGATEIVFKISQRVTTAALLTKSLTGASLSLGINTQFYFDISDVESAALPTGHLYCEAQITSSSGEKQTVFAGKFTVQDTLIGD